MAYRGEGGGGVAAGLLAAALIALGLVGAGWFVSAGIVESRIVDKRVTVKGLAEREVKADLALWPMTVTASGDDLGLVQDEIDRAVTAVNTFLTGKGFDTAEISLGRLQMEDRLSNSWGPDLPIGGRYLINQPMTVRTTSVDLVAGASRDLGELVRSGVVLTGWQGPSYIYTGLNDVKPDMIEEATRNARTAAQTFADDSGARLSGIRSANQGVFVILPRDPVMGEAEENQIFKTVRVVTTVTFQLED